jgi:hypothetical protein
MLEFIKEKVKLVGLELAIIQVPFNTVFVRPAMTTDCPTEKLLLAVMVATLEVTATLDIAIVPPEEYHIS